MSVVSHYSDVSIDPAIRTKAEKILELQKDKINLQSLETIKEEIGKLNPKALSRLDNADGQSQYGSEIMPKSIHSQYDLDRKSFVSKIHSIRHSDLKSVR
jgi:hypothetical protein